MKDVRDKLYRDLKLLPVFIHAEKDLLIDFITSLLILTNSKDKTYNFILIIINPLLKMIHYKQDKVTNNASDFTKVIIDIVKRYHVFINLIISNGSSNFNFKF